MLFNCCSPQDDATAYVIAEVNGHSDLCELLEKHSRLQRETETAVTEVKGSG